MSYSKNIFYMKLKRFFFFSFFFFFDFSPNAVLRLRFNHFATECSWDHMYVYDGDSIYAPLVAVLR